jgi:hypothetical protein
LSISQTVRLLLQGKKDIKVWTHGVYTIKDRRPLRILHPKTYSRFMLILAHNSSTKYTAKTNLDAQEKADKYHLETDHIGFHVSGWTAIPTPHTPIIFSDVQSGKQPLRGCKVNT